MMDKQIFRFPDTGQVECYDQNGMSIVPDAASPFSVQNGYNLRHPMCFTKLDITGNRLDESSTWSTGHRLTLDENTGLIWEIKSNREEDINFAGSSYTWEEAQALYISKLNDMAYGGHTDWRLPNKDELRSIMDYSHTAPAVNSEFFPNLPSDLYWTSVTYQMQPVFAWSLFSGLGSATAISKNSKRKVIAVCGGYEPLFGIMSDERFTDNEDGTVTDKVTGLMWQQGDNPRMNFHEASAYCKKLNLGGHTDWRLPNIKELNTILDLRRDGGWWFFRKFFPVEGLTPPLLHYLSGTSYERNYVWVTNFNYGYDGYYASKLAPLLFRAVRTVKEEKTKAFILPESGQDQCYDIMGNEIQPPSSGEMFYGQDGCFKIHPFSFHIDRGSHSQVVIDDNTGLMWERKSDIPGSFNYKKNRYTLEEARLYIAKLNQMAYNGYTDWRLPNCQELRSIVNYSDNIPAVNLTVFPETNPDFYWSNQGYVPNPNMQWGIYFAYGCAICNDKQIPFLVRAVRGGNDLRFGTCSKDAFTDNGDGTVSDMVTGLMWKKEESGQLGFKEALQYCNNLHLAGHDDWRLPNIREIATLLDINYTDKTWYHKEFFPNVITTPLGFYWSSSTYASTFGWGVNFQFGYDGYYADKINGKYPFRPVRNIK